MLCAGLLAVSICSTASAASKASRSIQLVPLGWPKRLQIPRFGVNASVESLKLNRPGDAEAPYKWGDVAWYDLGPKPGQHGRALIYGHLDSTCCPAVFYHLRDLKKGDVVQVSYKKGSLKFRVQWSAQYLNKQFPTKFVFTPVRERGLVLVTCSGAFHFDGTGYDHKLVVYARVILPNGRLG